MNTYEMMVIYKEILKETEVKKQITILKDKIKEFGGKVTSEDYWGLKDFAFEMKKETKGYYDIMYFELQPDKLDELSKWLGHQQDTVNRSLITKKE